MIGEQEEGFGKAGRGFARFAWESLAGNDLGEDWRGKCGERVDAERDDTYNALGRHWLISTVVISTGSTLSDIRLPDDAG